MGFTFTDSCVAAKTETSATSDIPGDRSSPGEQKIQSLKFRNGVVPSYDRIRLVRLPRDWCPSSLRLDDSTQSEGAGESEGDTDSDRYTRRLDWWPALVYETLHELVLDLPRENRLIKAKLLIEHRRNPSQPVARLLSWCPSKPSVVKVSTSMEMGVIRLAGKSIEDNEDPANGFDQLASFYDHHLGLERTCNDILSRGSSNLDKALGHALLFRKAFDLALDCVATDIGERPLSPRPNSALIPSIRSGLSKDSRSGKSQNIFIPTGTSTDTSRKSNPKESVLPSKGLKQKLPVDASVATKSKKAKKTYNHHELVPKVQGTPFKPGERWTKVWNMMERSGWKRIIDRRNSVYRYVKPQQKEKRGGRRRKEPLLTEDAVQAYAKKHYGWKEINTQDSEESDDDSNFSKASVNGDANSSSLKMNEISEKSPHKAVDEFVPPLKGPLIESSEPWKEVWKKLRSSGWHWKGGTGLMLDYFYIKPGRAIKGGVEGSDYFTKVEDVQRFVRRNYGWGAKRKRPTKSNGPITKQHGSTMGAFANKQAPTKAARLSGPEKRTNEKKMNQGATPEYNATPENSKTKPQDPAVPPPTPPTEDSCSSSVSMSSESFYDWNYLWGKLQQAGWFVVNAGKYNQLHDWYYVRPGCHPGDSNCKLGIHYFLSGHDVTDFVRKLDREMSLKSNSSSRVLGDFEEEARAAGR